MTTAPALPSPREEILRSSDIDALRLLADGRTTWAGGAELTLELEHKGYREMTA
jgi:Fe-S cluster assembly ATPase SufC